MVLGYLVQTRHSDMAQRMMCVSWLCVDAALFRRVLSVYCGVVVPYSAAPMCQMAGATFWSFRCVFTYHMSCTSTSVTVPSWYRPIGEIAPGCLLSAAALPGKAVCSIYQFSIAPMGEMAPGVPCKAWNKSFNCIIAPVCVGWHPSVRWHRGAQKNTINVKKKRSHPVPSHA